MAQNQGLCPTNNRVELFATQPNGFCYHWFTNKLVKSPRSIFITDGGNVLVLERGSSPSSVVFLQDLNNDGVADSSYVIAQVGGLTHGLTVAYGKVYASTDTTVYRWSYSEGQTTISTDIETAVYNMNADGKGGAPQGHTTRTLVHSKSSGYLYISIGSYSNIDLTSYRSAIRRVLLTSPIPSIGYDFSNLEVFAYGLRNEVGLALDKHDILWGVENSGDNLYREDLGGDIHNDNPAEELNRFYKAGLNFGYPYCFTEFNLSKEVGLGKGSIWAWPSTMNDGIHNDSWCCSQTIPPTIAIQAHSAPLGITFFNASKVLDSTCASGIDSGSFPASFDGFAFIAFHGSWNRIPPTGYKVVYIPMDNATGLPLPTVTSPLPMDFFCHEGPGAVWPARIRPVDVKFDRCNRLLISTDGSGTGAGIIVVTYNQALVVAVNSTSSLSPFTCGSGPSAYSSIGSSVSNTIANASDVNLIIILCTVLGSLFLLTLAAGITMYYRYFYSSKKHEKTVIVADDNNIKSPSAYEMVDTQTFGTI